MSALSTCNYQRQISDVTQDIRRKTGEFLVTAIEIGRLLFEAKSMVEPGGWSKYIEEELPFSHSWANNYMKLYTEFGSDQTSLFGNSQTFMKLRPTQALEVLRLPEDQREEFVESHDVEDMSTRQLRQAVRDQLDEERRKHEQTRKELEAAEARARDAERNVVDMQGRLSASRSSEDAWREQIDKLTADRKRAEQSETNALGLVKKLEKQLQAAQEQEKTVREELEQAREHPEVPESMMEQLRKEAEVAANQKNTGDIQKKLDAANAALAEAEAKAREAEDKLAAVQKKLKMADPDVMEYNTLSQKLMSDYNVLDGLRRKISVHDPETGSKLKQFQTKMVSVWSDGLGKA